MSKLVEVERGRVQAEARVPVFAHPMACARGRVVGEDVIEEMIDELISFSARLRVPHKAPKVRKERRVPAAALERTA